MRTATLTFTVSSLILGILFLAFQVNVPHDESRNTAARAVATALGAHEPGSAGIMTQRDAPATNSQDDDHDSGAIRLVNDGN